MPHEEYAIEIEDGGDFDVEFTHYAKVNHRGAARLIKRLEAFAKNPQKLGDYLRGASARNIYVVPSRDNLDGDGEAGLLALIDKDAKTVLPLRFIHPSSKHRWQDYEAWAETVLSI